MADPSVPNVFVNGQVADAPDVNENFTAIIAAISSASTADLGCATLKIAAVTFSSAVVSAMQSASVNQLTVVNTFSAGTISGTAGQFTDLSINGQTIASFVASGVVETGTFTATVSGISLMSWGSPLEIKYIKVNDVVTLHVPAFGGLSDGATNLDIDGLPAAIQRTAGGGTFYECCMSGAGFLNSSVALTTAAYASIYGGNLDSIMLRTDANHAVWATGGQKGTNSRRLIIYTTT